MLTPARIGMAAGIAYFVVNLVSLPLKGDLPAADAPTSAVVGARRDRCFVRPQVRSSMDRVAGFDRGHGLPGRDVRLHRRGPRGSADRRVLRGIDRFVALDPVARGGLDREAFRLRANHGHGAASVRSCTSRRQTRGTRRGTRFYRAAALLVTHRAVVTTTRQRLEYSPGSYRRRLARNKACHDACWPSDTDHVHRPAPRRLARVPVHGGLPTTTDR